MGLRDKEAILKLTFEWDGKTVHKETSGFKGKDCETVTAFIEKALGATEVEKTHTKEYHEDNRRPEDRLRN